MGKLIILIALFGVFANSQVIFEDEDLPPRRQQFGNNLQLVISFDRDRNQNQNRPNQQFQQTQFQRPNNGFGNQNGFQQSSQSSSPSSFGTQRPFQGQGTNFQRPNQNFQQQHNHQSFQVEQRSDCRTYFDSEGFCTPLNACGRIARDIQNGSPVVVARILGRSICGFQGVIPKVCCPSSRAQNSGSHQNGNEPSKENNFNNNGNNFNDPNKGSDKKPVNNNGGGLVIIPPPNEQFTTSTPRPFQTKPTKKPNSGGGLVIGDGPITLIPGGNGEVTEGFSDEGLPQDCGFSDAKHQRIIGGTTAKEGAWPWIAALGYKDQAGNINYLCGGALISPNYVLTASHCVYGRDDLASVRLGDHDLYSTQDGVTPLDVGVEKTILHPKYDPATFKNDIALLRLKQSVPFSKQIHPVCLPTTPKLRNQRFENVMPYVAGWGAIQFNGPSSSVLREVQIPTVPDSECQAKYSSFKSAVVDDTNLCAGLQAGGKDACQGDSGGPLMQPVGTNKYVLIGIVSFGFKCAEPGFPGVYSRVTSHVDWIQNTIIQ